MNEAEPTTHDDLHEEESCAEVINDAVSGEAGIVNVSVDTQQQMVTFDYNPAKISDVDVAAVAQRLAPTLHQRWHTCTMRLEKHGGRACESCALALERDLQQLPGVQRA
ncbi:MAG: heavy-metal-associated domain-containing protein, partial [Anaerolineales bacterium]|nr:heavy-metal-associated domain-containing protein [Anaerolineales bacterium]